MYTLLLITIVLATFPYNFIGRSQPKILLNREAPIGIVKARCLELNTVRVVKELGMEVNAKQIKYP
jgi:hypothetical protein